VVEEVAAPEPVADEVAAQQVVEKVVASSELFTEDIAAPSEPIAEVEPEVVEEPISLFDEIDLATEAEEVAVEPPVEVLENTDFDRWWNPSWMISTLPPGRRLKIWT